MGDAGGALFEGADGGGGAAFGPVLEGLASRLHQDDDEAGEGLIEGEGADDGQGGDDVGGEVPLC